MEISQQALRKVQEGLEELEELSDLMANLASGEAQIVYRCRTHDLGHLRCNPMMGVQHVERSGVDGTAVTLKCGHKIVLPVGVVTAKGEVQPCVWCSEDCHS